MTGCWRRNLISALALAVVLLPAVPAAAQTAAVDIFDFGYDPQQLSVEAGTTVTWTNTGDVAHTVTAEDGAFDSGTLDPAATFEFTFDAAGTYAYFCEIHPDRMSGTVTVAAAATATPQPTESEQTAAPSPGETATPSPGETATPSPGETADEPGSGSVDDQDTETAAGSAEDDDTAGREQLAFTGLDSSGLVALAAVALLLGAGVLMISRRRVVARVAEDGGVRQDRRGRGQRLGRHS